MERDFAIKKTNPHLRVINPTIKKLFWLMVTSNKFKFKFFRIISHKIINPWNVIGFF